MGSKFAAGQPVRVTFDSGDPTVADFQVPVLSISPVVFEGGVIWLGVEILSRLS
jgi:hypothetical protein